MIKRIRSDKSSFRTITFEKGLNVILAERSESSSDKDSRNGLGKTSIIEIIHFCLGAKLKNLTVLNSKELYDWTFTLDLTLKGKDFSIHRNTARPQRVIIEGEDFSDWPIKPQKEGDQFVMKIEELKKVLGFLMFNLSLKIYQKKYTPTFRSLISYFARLSDGAFKSPFKIHAQQPEWSIQVNNAYLLGLNWEYASEFQILKEQTRTLQQLKKAATEGLLEGYIGDLGELEAVKIKLQSKIEKLEKQLSEFKVHPHYREIEHEANKLTEKIHELSNERLITREILNRYKKNIEDERDVSLEEVISIYKEVGFLFPDSVKKHLNDVKNFHNTIIKNRKHYLSNEINKLTQKLQLLDHNIKELSEKRAKLMEILNTHKALDEHIRIREQLTELKQQLADINNRIDNLKKFQTGLNELKIKKAELYNKTLQDFEERKKIKERALIYFNRISEFLYEEPGTLSINVTETGYKFHINIPRSSSTGITHMKIFTYDLTLIQLREDIFNGPGFLIHDSTIFSEVDERQVARAIELVAKEAKQKGFQYICAFNSDMIPYAELDEDTLKIFKDSVRITLTDESPEKSLFGIRF